MPRVCRAVWPGIPCHVTQRGNRRGRVFFGTVDRLAYLKLLKEYAARHAVEILAYCLMDNHVHLVLVPSTEDGLHRVLRPVHMRHAQRVNRSRGWRGHLWQGRFFSSMLDEAYLWAAIRYVELNPVRAGMVRRAEDYRWSSAPAHCSRRSDPCLTTEPSWQARLAAIVDWSAWLESGERPERMGTLRANAGKGFPCGSDAFVERLERLTGRCLRELPRGRPRRNR